MKQNIAKYYIYLTYLKKNCLILISLSWNETPLPNCRMVIEHCTV